MEPRLQAAEHGPGRVAAEFDRVYAREHAAIVRLAYLLVRDEQVAEELAQEAFLRLYATFADVEHPPGFLRTVVVRLAATARTRRDLERRRLALVPRPVATSPEEPDDEVWAAIGRLRPERATVLVLRFYQDLDHREIGRIVGSSTATVRSRVRRALADLRQELRP